jgi:hypothetical protein
MEVCLREKGGGSLSCPLRYTTLPGQAVAYHTIHYKPKMQVRVVKKLRTISFMGR